MIRHSMREKDSQTICKENERTSERKRERGEKVCRTILIRIQSFYSEEERNRVKEKKLVSKANSIYRHVGCTFLKFHFLYSNTKSNACRHTDGKITEAIECLDDVRSAFTLRIIDRDVRINIALMSSLAPDEWLRDFETCLNRHQQREERRENVDHRQNCAELLLSVILFLFVLSTCHAWSNSTDQFDLNFHTCCYIIEFTFTQLRSICLACAQRDK